MVEKPFFENLDNYKLIIGAAMKQPILLHNVPRPIDISDFPKSGESPARCIFYALNILANENTHSISAEAIEAKLSEDMRAIYNSSSGREFIEEALDKGKPEDFLSAYKTLKKDALLRRLKNLGYEIDPFDTEKAKNLPFNDKKREEIQIRYDKADEDEILGYVEQRLQLIKTEFSGGSLGSSDASDKIDKLIAALGEESDYGAPLLGDMLNSIVRGQRLGCMYLRSAASGGSKTRSSVFDACEGVYPILWDDRGYWRYNSVMTPKKTLFVMTEQKPEEIQLMILAFISGVEERRIRSNLMTKGERDRVLFAAEEMKHYAGYFSFEEVNDPNLHNVSNIIKKHVIQNNVNYVYYDYIFASPSLLSEINKNLRTDQALMLLSNQLKEIAKTYNIFIMTSTQLNGNGMESGKKRDQTMLSNAKSLADKVDIGMIVAPVDDVEVELIKNILDEKGLARPTHVIDVYKIRSGRFRGVRVWTSFNPGNGRRKDLFITDSDNHYMRFEEGELLANLRDNAEIIPLDNLYSTLQSLPVEVPMERIERNDEF